MSSRNKSDVRPQLDDVYGYFRPHTWDLKELGNIQQIDFHEYTPRATNKSNMGKTTPIIIAYTHCFPNVNDLIETFGDSTGRGCPHKRTSPQDKLSFGPIFPTGKNIFKMERIVRNVLIYGYGFSRELAEQADIYVKKMIVYRNEHMLTFASKREKNPTGKPKFLNYLFLSSVDGRSAKEMSLSEAQGYVEGISHALCEFNRKTISVVTNKEIYTCSNSGRVLDIFE